MAKAWCLHDIALLWRYSYALSICELVGISPSNGKENQGSASHSDEVCMICLAGDLTSVCQLTSAYWQQVVMFFLLRLVLAPCVETLLLLDRILFLREEGQPSTQILLA